MSEYLRILDKKFEGDFSSDPYDFGFGWMTFKSMQLQVLKTKSMC